MCLDDLLEVGDQLGRKLELAHEREMSGVADGSFTGRNDTPLGKSTEPSNEAVDRWSSGQTENGASVWAAPSFGLGANAALAGFVSNVEPGFGGHSSLSTTRATVPASRCRTLAFAVVGYHGNTATAALYRVAHEIWIPVL